MLVAERPARQPRGADSKTVIAYVDRDVHQRLKIAAARRDVFVADIVREAIARELERIEREGS